MLTLYLNENKGYGTGEKEATPWHRGCNPVSDDTGHLVSPESQIFLSCAAEEPRKGKRERSLALKQSIQPLKNQTGFALVVALFVITILAILAIGFLSTAVNEDIFATNFRNKNQAFYAAEAGLESGLVSLRTLLSTTGANPVWFLRGWMLSFRVSLAAGPFLPLACGESRLLILPVSPHRFPVREQESGTERGVA